jgi:DNA invertase Pin-like site-specific DNA recombinase
MKYGYCRISRPKQSIERQIRNIKAAYPDAVIVQEVFTRTRLDRKEWPKLVKKVQPGDTIIFDSVSRMSGNAEEGFAAYEELYHRGVSLVFLKEPHINTDTYKKALENNVQLTGGNVDFILEGVNRYLLELAKEQIRLAFEQSEKEVEDLHQRTREGIETARLNGKQIGRRKDSKIVTKKSVAAKELILKHSQSFSGTLGDKDVIRLTGLNRNTYYKYKRELRERADDGAGG